MTEHMRSKIIELGDQVKYVWKKSYARNLGADKTQLDERP